MKTFLYSLILIFLISIVTPAMAQLPAADDTVTIYGAVLDAESIAPVPYASVYVKGKPKGVVTDSTGAFVLTAIKSDTLQFSAVGFKQGTMVLPSNLPDDRYTMIQLMLPDTILLDEVVVFSYPTISAFKSAFNEVEEEEGLGSEAALQRKLDDLLYETYKDERFYYDYMRYNRLYQMTGIFPPNNFINPAQWTNFIRDWRAGKFDTEAPLPDQQIRRGINLIDDDQ